MNVLITRRQPLNVVGMLIRTNLQENRIRELWTEFIARMDELQETAVPECSLGICSTIEGEEDENCFEYMAARVVKDDSVIPSGMIFRRLPEQEVAVFTHQGSLDTLGETYDYIYHEWLPASGYEIAEADEIEWYDRRFKYEQKDSEMDVHIPIKPKKTADEILDHLILVSEKL